MATQNEQKKEITKNDRAIMDGIRYAINHYPLHRRIVFAWRIIRGKF